MSAARFIGVVLAAIVVVVLAISLSAAVWFYVIWPLFFEQWLGPIPWRGAFGVAFLFVSLGSRGLRAKSAA